MVKDLSIHFGTSGWRAVIGDEFTFANVRKVCRAIAKYVKDLKLSRQGVVVGYDTRFLSQEFAQTCAQTLAENNITAFLTNRDAPTPVISYQILKRKAAGGINITASHNPPKYNGIKFSPAYGGPAPLEVTRQIEKNIKLARPCSSKRQSTVKIFDPRPAYLTRIKQLVDFQAIRKARLRIGVDVLYGTGRAYLDELLRSAGSVLTVLHKELNPSFGGLPPEPAREQLRELTSLVKKKRLHLGLATDGDADRFGIVDRDGTYIGANEVISLLTYHMIATRPKQKSLARTLATTHMVDELAQKADLEVVETPVGFKYIGQEIAGGDCLIGCEESGGLSIVGHVPEKDGILACLLIAELVAVRKKSLGEILKELYQEVGLFVNTRIDFHLKQKEKTNFMRNLKPFSRKSSLLGEEIIKFDGRDGYKFVFSDASWIMFRPSGTEAIVRCYCEARTRLKLKKLKQLGQRLLKRFAKNLQKIS